MSSENPSAADLGDEAVIGGETDLQRLRDEARAGQDRALRAQAELENFRTRMRRDMDEERKYAAYGLLTDLLPVIDNVSRAIEAADKVEGAANLVSGFKMVAQQLEGVLERHNCTKIAAENQPFDPHLHQAVAQQARPDLPPNTVVAVYQNGYRLHDRVLRPAQVVVSTS